MILNPWLTSSLGLLAIWIAIFILKPNVRKEMFWISLFTMPAGLTEPLFVPEYWNPPSLFNLAQTTGFDIESLIFSFSIGGIGSVLYELIVKTRHKKLSAQEKHSKMHRFHPLALFSPLIAFLILYLFTKLNPIYSTSISMLVGSVATVLCRPDLKKKVLIGGVSFLSLYFVFFVLFNLIYPDLVQTAWNLQAISGIIILGVPVEELMFAFAFGTLWSGLYEHIKWYKIWEKK